MLHFIRKRLLENTAKVAGSLRQIHIDSSKLVPPIRRRRSITPVEGLALQVEKAGPSSLEEQSHEESPLKGTFSKSTRLDKALLQDEVYEKLSAHPRLGLGNSSPDIPRGEKSLESEMRAIEQSQKRDRLNKNLRRRESSLENKTKQARMSSAHERFLETLNEQKEWPWKVQDERIEDGVLSIEESEGIAQWFPGHMAKTFKDIGERLKDVHVVIEVRDARIPFSSANPMLDEIVGGKPRIVVFGKADLAGKASLAVPSILEAFNKSLRELYGNAYANHAFVQSRAEISQAISNAKVDGTLSFVSKNKRMAFVFVNSKSYRVAAEVLHLLDIVAPKQAFKTVPTAALICGFPNVGKSTLINALRALSEASNIQDGSSYTLTGDPFAVQLSLSSGSASLQLPQANSPTKIVEAQHSKESKTGESRFSDDALKQAEMFAIGGASNSASNSSFTMRPASNQKTVYLNTNRKTKDAKVGPEPGVTRHVSGFKVQENPPIVILDSPGVMVPKISSNTVAARLALVGSIADKIVGIDLIAQYLLQCLNRNEQFAYVNVFKLPSQSPTNDLRYVLFHVSKSMGMKDAHLDQWVKEVSSGKPDLVRSEKKRYELARREMQEGLRPHEYITIMDMSPDLEKRTKYMFIKMYRSGALGRFFLDAQELGLTK